MKPWCFGHFIHVEGSTALGTCEHSVCGCQRHAPGGLWWAHASVGELSEPQLLSTPPWNGTMWNPWISGFNCEWLEIRINPLWIDCIQEQKEKEALGECFLEMILSVCTLQNVNPPLWLGGNKLLLSLKGMASLKQQIYSSSNSTCCNCRWNKNKSISLTDLQIFSYPVYSSKDLGF